ncbi:MAG TPA: HPF/RaiA family ribosome-associated protein [Tepidisphaeraceae bacterium]|nr:HPF/RaiA family ribosome-associated protein [Tepidisphaeraceae bacterium]
MELSVRGLNFDLTDAILAHVRQRLAEGLSHYAPRLQGVMVRVSDVNGPRGGADKRCHIEVTLPGTGAVFVDEVHADLYRAVDRAVARLRTRLGREFGRRGGRGPRVSASGLPT